VAVARSDLQAMSNRIAILVCLDTAMLLQVCVLEPIWPSQKLGFSGDGTCDQQEQEGSDAHN
jgi:hypothetical protein